MVTLVLIFFHWVSDFLMQSDYTAKNKSSNNYILLDHVMKYSLLFLGFFGWQFALVNAVAHFITDYFTSRWTKKLWEAGNTHYFFVVVGFDQFFHVATLLISYHILAEYEMIDLFLIQLNLI